jgi:hypothetical protein
LSQLSGVAPIYEFLICNTWFGLNCPSAWCGTPINLGFRIYLAEFWEPKVAELWELPALLLLTMVIFCTSSHGREFNGLSPALRAQLNQTRFFLCIWIWKVNQILQGLLLHLDIFGGLLRRFLVFGDYYCTWIVFGDYYCTWIVFRDYYCTWYSTVIIPYFGDYSASPSSELRLPTFFKTWFTFIKCG